MGRDSWAVAETFIGNPLVTLAIGLVLLVIGLRMDSASQGWFVLVAAWLLFVASAYRAMGSQPRVPRALWSMLVAAIVGLLLYYYEARSTKPKTTVATSTTASVPTASESKLAEEIADAVARKWAPALPPPNAELCRRTHALTQRMREMVTRQNAESRKLSDEHDRETRAVRDLSAEPRDEARARFIRHGLESSNLSEQHIKELRDAHVLSEANYYWEELRRRLQDDSKPELIIDLTLSGRFISGNGVISVADLLDRLAKKLCPSSS